MQSSHKWRVLRHIGMEADSRTCVRCGDNLANEVRYCPGVTENEDNYSSLGEQPQLPLEADYPNRATGANLV